MTDIKPWSILITIATIVHTYSDYLHDYIMALIIIIVVRAARFCEMK